MPWILFSESNVLYRKDLRPNRLFDLHVRIKEFPNKINSIAILIEEKRAFIIDEKGVLFGIDDIFKDETHVKLQQFELDDTILADISVDWLNKDIYMISTTGTVSKCPITPFKKGTQPKDF